MDDFPLDGISRVRSILGSADDVSPGTDEPRRDDPRDPPPAHVQAEQARAYGGVIRPKPQRASRFYSAADLKERTVKARQWLVPEMIPARNVTLFSGDGGTGKSLLALQLAVAVSAGTLWAGRQVHKGSALMISAEDEDEELHRRIDDILRAEGRGYDDLASLTLRSLAGEDALLASDDPVALTSTALFEELEERVQLDAPDLVVLDTLADFYPANENDRTKVRQFVGLLRGLALRRNCAVVLLAHPSLTGLASGSGLSGSTAWHGSVRSRLYLSRVVRDGQEEDTRKRVLSVKKQNYADTGAETVLTWSDGIFRVDAAESGLDRVAKASKAERVFLKLLRKFAEQGRRVNHVGAATYAPKVFAEHPDCEGVTRDGFRTAMEVLMASGRVKIASEGPASRRVQYLVEGVE